MKLFFVERLISTCSSIQFWHYVNGVSNVWVLVVTKHIVEYLQKFALVRP